MTDIDADLAQVIVLPLRRSLLLDREAIEAAAQSVESIGGYRSWDQLSVEQRKVVLRKTETIIEAYAGALDSC